MGLLTAAVGVGTHLLFGEFSHLLASLAGPQQQPETESEPESGSHVSVGAPGDPRDGVQDSLFCLLSQIAAPCLYPPSP